MFNRGLSHKTYSTANPGNAESATKKFTLAMQNGNSSSGPAISEAGKEAQIQVSGEMHLCGST
jgi:hypothetical protein